MREYDNENYSPPAPVAHVTVVNPDTGAAIDNVPMLIDTGADVTLLPRSAVSSILSNLTDLPRHQLAGFDGTRSEAEAVRLELRFFHKGFRGKFLLLEGEHGILGRNVLNSSCILIDGPNLRWGEQVSQ